MGFIDDGMIPVNQLYFVPTDSRYLFGVLNSQFHQAWMRSVGGRLESRYRYANTVVYNNFIWPDADEATQECIASLAQAVLDARELYEGATLADMYDPDNDFLYPELLKAHAELDAAVEAAYGVDFSDSADDAEREQRIVAHLFELYNEAVG